MIVVMPDGDDGFYTTWNFLGDWTGCRRNRPPNAEPADSYCVPWPHYDEYIVRDLVGYIDRRYRTVADRRRRGIAGLSMGGYGAITLALAYPDVFSAAASHSASSRPRKGGGRGVSPRDALTSIHFVRRGPRRSGRSSAPRFWKGQRRLDRSGTGGPAARLRGKRPEMMPPLYVDCGTDDFLLHQNRAFRDAKCVF